ncbi:hypothetical protein HYALB_00000757 [Hymenoscyphus albidus]|uniref:Uncharacterized protein n=1 Tax=Hymenoscyphus albidus TaxID=595503 RepID=A0A9N9LRZ9_9HELO|nr:hypothetical protein HYALB_00000757 [Hymenoscyphus albidus]
MSNPNKQNTPNANQAKTCFDGMGDMLSALLQENTRIGESSTNTNTNSNTNRDDSIGVDAARIANTFERDVSRRVMAAIARNRPEVLPRYQELKVLIETETDKRKLLQYLREQVEIVSSLIRR